MQPLEHNIEKKQKNYSIQAGGFKRQPTKYPHGLDITVHTVNEERLNYSRASTLRSSRKQDSIMPTRNNECLAEPTLRVIGNSEHLKELQVRRFKYPSTASYYLDTQDNTHVQKTTPYDVYAHIKRWCGKRHFRWFIMIMAGALFCFGLISYCLWLHNISVAREKFRKEHFLKDDKLILSNDFSQDSMESSTQYWRVTDFEEEQYSLENLHEHEEHIPDISNNVQFEKPGTSTGNNFARVSPTIPPIPKTKPTVINLTARTTIPESRCFSTSLPMCQGVMDYDLTYNSTINLDPMERDAFNTLIQSNCSARAIEFICVALQPECRPRHIGALAPCRRVCKAILEACSIVISNVDPLLSLFDCNLYPDSNDANICEDFTRRKSSCYDNEFQCGDQTCIPHQWQCDNIKDCATEEDETSCLICENQDEFRCRSNDKCVPESVRCDLQNDCFDASDEENCEEIGSGEESSLDEVSLSDSFARIFSYATFLLPNASYDGPYSYVTTTAQEPAHTANNSATTTKSAEGSIKGFVNFRDSKEIMITSDSENKYKFSAAGLPTNLPKDELTTPLTPAISHSACETHQLRCVTGHCITVDQLCDKVGLNAHKFN